MTKKQALRCVAFFMVVLAVIVILCDLFESKNTLNFDKRITTFRNLPEDTVDVVFMGTSGMDRYWLAPKAFEEYGITGYCYSTEAMPTWLFTNVIDEIYNYQNPELLIIDLRAFGQDNNKASVMDVRARRVIDSMNFLSLNRIKTSIKAMRTIHKRHKDEPILNASLLFSFIKYHSQWSEDSYRFSSNIGNREHEYASFYVNSTLSTQIEPQKPLVYDNELKVELDETAEESLFELIDYIKEKKLNVLFVDTPQFKNEEEMGRANVVMDILDKNDLEYINFSDTDNNGSFLVPFGFDLAKDFYDEGHTNFYGAEKFTDYFAEYLDENYDLPDRREQSEVAKHWNGRYDAVLKKIASYEAKKEKK